MLIIGAMQAATAIFAFQSPDLSKVIACMLIGMAGNIMKQNAIYPPPSDNYDQVDEEEVETRGEPTHYPGLGSSRATQHARRSASTAAIAQLGCVDM